MTKTHTLTTAFVATTLLVVPLLFVGTSTAFARDIFSGTSGNTENSDGGNNIPAQSALLQVPSQASASLQASPITANNGTSTPLPTSRQRDLRDLYINGRERANKLQKEAQTRQNDFRERSQRLRSEMEAKAKEDIQRLRKDGTHARDSFGKYANTYRGYRNAPKNGDKTENKKRENFLRFKRTVTNDRSPLTGEVRREKGAVQSQVKEIRRERNAFSHEIQARREKIQEALDAAKTSQEKGAVLKQAREEGALLRTEALKRRDEFRARAKTLREEFKTQREALRAKVKTEVAKRIKGRLEDILGRISDALSNFTDILGRVHNGIAELNANGVDTTDATAAAATAEKAIGDASVALSNARTTFNSILESSSPKDQIKEVRASVKEAIVTVKAAHTKLGEAIRILKNTMSTNNNTPPTTTPTQTSTSSTPTTTQAPIVSPVTTPTSGN